jgi:sigma-B regulation protein RsbU (phosphoserine phosphatase)
MLAIDKFMGTTPVDNRLAQLEAENRRLRQAVEELSIINEVATAVSSTSPLDQVVELIVQKCVKHLKVDQGAVLLFEKQEEAAALKTMVRKVQTNLRTIPYRLGDQITGWMLKNQQPLVINDFKQDGRFRLPAEAEADVRSLLCVPLRLKGRMIGVLSVFNKRGSEGFSENDQRLLAIIGAQSAQVIENARLYEEEKSLQKIQQEVQMARDIQTRLLPKAPPVVPGFDIAGKSVSAQNVGGDYFDFLEFRDGRLGLCLADVSGKGISASLLMANVQATVRGQSVLGNSAAQCLHNSNLQLYQSTDTDKYVTLFYGVLDAAKREMQYSNAGHNPPLLIKNGQTTLLNVGGPVLGILPEAAFEEATISFDPGDLLLIYSDGYSEAMNHAFEEFGEDRLLAIAKQHANAPAAELIARIGEDVRKHCAGAAQTDDMTMIAVRATE